MKSAKVQAEDQCKELYTTQLNLATEKAAVLDLQSKLQRAEEALKVAQEATIATEVVVCREYCAETYNQALDRVGIPVDSDLRRVDQVYYPEELRENTIAPLPPPEKSLPAQKPSQDTEVPVGAEKEKNEAVMASWTEERAKEKEKEKEKGQNKADANPSKDALTIRDMVSKAKLVESKSKIDPKKDSHQSQT